MDLFDEMMADAENLTNLRQQYGFVVAGSLESQIDGEPIVWGVKNDGECFAYRLGWTEMLAVNREWWETWSGWDSWPYPWNEAGEKMVLPPKDNPS